MPGAQNGIVSESYGTDIPETQIDEVQLIEEEKAAKYSKSHEYKKLKSHWEARIKYYQTFLPDGRVLSELPDEERGRMWLAASIIIAELTNAMSYYDNAEEIIKTRVQ